jgi:hypothetical protein
LFHTLLLKARQSNLRREVGWRLLSTEKLLCLDEAAHEKRNKDTDNFLVTVGDG